MAFDVRDLFGSLFNAPPTQAGQTTATSPSGVISVAAAPTSPPDSAEPPGDLGAYVREHGCYPPEGLANWEWRPGERPGPPDPGPMDWESGIPWEKVLLP